MFEVPDDRGVQVISSQFGPKFVHDPEWYWHHEPDQIRPSNKLVSLPNGKQLMTVRMAINKFEGGELKIR